MNLIDGIAEQLSATVIGNIAASYNDASGILTLSGNDTIANYQQVLRTIIYSNLAPTGTERVFEFTVDDGEAHSNTSAVATTTLTFDLLNPINGNDKADVLTGTPEADRIQKDSEAMILSWVVMATIALMAALTMIKSWAVREMILSSVGKAMTS